MDDVRKTTLYRGLHTAVALLSRWLLSENIENMGRCLLLLLLKRLYRGFRTVLLNEYLLRIGFGRCFYKVVVQTYEQ